MAKKYFLRTKETKGRANLYIEVRKRTPMIYSDLDSSEQVR